MENAARGAPDYDGPAPVTGPRARCAGSASPAIGRLLRGVRPRSPLVLFREHRPRADRFRASRSRASVWFASGALLVLLAPVLPFAEQAKADGTPARLISLNPSLTSILVRLGARETLVGVDDYSAQVVSEVADLPRVGGLFDPSLEAVVALGPERVLLVAGVDQEGHAARLARAGVEVDVYPNETLAQVFENIERLGRLVGREAAA